MSLRARTLIIPVEIKVRELQAKLLLAGVAAARGFKVYLGERYAIQGAAHRLPPGLYFGKDITLPATPLYRQLNRLGHHPVAQDEEALVYYTREIYRQRRFCAETAGEVRALFAWGEDNVELWCSMPDFPGRPIHPTGNPRFDLLRPEFAYFHAEAAAALRERYGPFILINTNFAHVNSFINQPKMPDPALVEAGLVEKLPRYYDPVLSGHRNRIFESFLAMVPALAAALPEVRFVLRPHPGENLERWRALLADRPNITVIHEGAVTPWLAAAKGLVHNGCTTAIEGWFQRLPAIAYTAVSRPGYDIRLPNDFSYEVSEPESLIAAVRDIWEGRPLGGKAHAEQQQALARRYFTALDGPLAADHIVDVLATMPSPPAIPPLLPRLEVELPLRRKAIKRRFQPKQLDAERRALKEQRQAWKNKNFGPTTLAEIETGLARLAQGRPGLAAVRVREIGTNLFLLRGGPAGRAAA
jgi:surface carbohydrate biosynthesis protein